MPGLSTDALLERVARRLEREPSRVRPALLLIADPDRLPGEEDESTPELAKLVNAERLSQARQQFADRAFTTAQVCQILGVSRQAVASRVAHRRLLALKVDGTLRYPDWQFGPDGIRPGLPNLLADLLGEERGVLAADALMRSPIPEAGGRSPAALMDAGEVEEARWFIRSATGGV